MSRRALLWVAIAVLATPPTIGWSRVPREAWTVRLPDPGIDRAGAGSRHLATTTAGGVSGRIAALFDSIVPAELAATGTPGAAVAVVIGDRVAYAKGFGVSSVETDLPVTRDMLFRIASTTKMLTAAAVLAATANG